jgi:predicted dienelactone hydrolase
VLNRTGEATETAGKPRLIAQTYGLRDATHREAASKAFTEQRRQLPYAMRVASAAVPMFRALLLSLAFATGAAPAAAWVETRLLMLTGREAAVDFYTPAVPPRALAVIAHGFARSRTQHVVLAERLAQAGFLVAVPDLPHWLRHDANADAIVELVAVMLTEGKLDALPVVLIGTSAGGLATLLATERVPRMALWIGLDPVDAFGQSRDAARRLRAPAVVLRAPSGACNVSGSARRIAAWLPNRRMERRIDGASHCDFEDTTNWRCESICGPADPVRQTLIVAETIKLAREAVAD